MACGFLELLEVLSFARNKEALLARTLIPPRIQPTIDRDGRWWSTNWNTERSQMIVDYKWTTKGCYQSDLVSIQMFHIVSKTSDLNAATYINLTDSNSRIHMPLSIDALCREETASLSGQDTKTKSPKENFWWWIVDRLRKPRGRKFRETKYFRGSTMSQINMARNSVVKE